MKKMPKWTIVSAILAAALGLSACDVEKKEEGRMPKVDVDVKEGKLPDYDVDAPDVDVKTEKKTITVPDVDVNTEKKTINVPDVDVDMPKDDNAVGEPEETER